MNRQIWPGMARKLLQAYAGLPRRGISIRASHHVFNAESEMEEIVDGVWGAPYSSFPQLLAGVWTN